MNNTSLMYAAHTGNLPLVKMLLPARATVNQQGKREMSALHLAARKGDARIVRVLLQSNADVNQKSQIGTVEQLARRNGSSELLEVLGLVQESKPSETQFLSAKNLTAAQ